MFWWSRSDPKKISNRIWIHADSIHWQTYSNPWPSRPNWHTLQLNKKKLLFLIRDLYQNCGQEILEFEYHRSEIWNLILVFRINALLKTKFIVWGFLLLVKVYCKFQEVKFEFPRTHPISSQSSLLLQNKII